MRGVEVTVRGSVYRDDGQYFLTATDRLRHQSSSLP